MAKEKTILNTKSHRSGAGALIPGGLLLGMGTGFIVGNIPGWMFLGLGLGFVAFAIIKLLKK